MVNGRYHELYFANEFCLPREIRDKLDDQVLQAKTLAQEKIG